MRSKKFCCLDFCIEMSHGWRITRAFYWHEKTPGSNFTTFTYYRLLNWHCRSQHRPSKFWVLLIQSSRTAVQISVCSESSRNNKESTWEDTSLRHKCVLHNIWKVNPPGLTPEPKAALENIRRLRCQQQLKSSLGSCHLHLCEIRRDHNKEESRIALSLPNSTNQVALWGLLLGFYDPVLLSNKKTLEK